jgi:molecular chaperone DnaK
MGKFIGIDLGTTYSVVAYINANGRPEVIPNEYGKAITPSVVYLGGSVPVVGDEAKDRQAAGAKEVASFFKRNMGNTEFVLSFGDRDYTPVDLSALVLAYLKKQAENFFGEAVTDAVITVPAYFAHTQRTATIEAGRRAGFNVLKIISEPTAAALAYGLRPSQKKQSVLVYDLGGGTFDISLVEITPTELRVRATDGDHNLGGKDWDERLMTYLASQFEQEFGVELLGDDVNELRVQAEQLKLALTAKQNATVRVQAQGNVGTYTVTREQFESLTGDLMERTQLLTEHVLEESHLSWSNLDGVLPVGGSTRMPMVLNYIEQMSGRPAMGGINKDEAVALGATIQAAMEIEAAATAPDFLLSGRKSITDVIAHSLGLIAESADRERYINSILIAKNKEIPSLRTRPYRLLTRRSGHTELEVFLTQGESDDPQACAYLGRYVFTDFPSVAAGKEATLDITYEYDKNGVVHVSAVE